MSHERSSNIHFVTIYQCSVYFGQKVSHKGLAKFALLELKCSNMDKRPSYLWHAEYLRVGPWQMGILQRSECLAEHLCLTKARPWPEGFTVLKCVWVMLMLTFCLWSHKCDESTRTLNYPLTFAGDVNLLRQGLLLLVVSLELWGVEHLAVHLEHALGAHRLLAQHPEVTNNHKLSSLSVNHCH